MKLKRSKWFAAGMGIDAVLPNSKSVKFNYALLQAKSVIEEERKTFYEANKRPEEFQKYEKKRIELCKKFTLKDEGGEPVQENLNFKIDPRQREGFDKEIESLREEFKDVLKEVEDLDKQTEKMLDEEVDLKVPKIPIEMIPEDTVDGQCMEVLYPLIKG